MWNFPNLRLLQKLLIAGALLGVCCQLTWYLIIAKKINRTSSSAAVRAHHHCDMDTCFDFSICPSSKPFSFYVYPSDTADPGDIGQNFSDSSSSLKILNAALSKSLYKSDKIEPACVFIILVDVCELEKVKMKINLPDPDWFGTGKNHIIWFTCDQKQNESEFFKIQAFFGKAMLIRQHVLRKELRRNFDMITSHWYKPSLKVSPEKLPKISPARRKYLASYLGDQISPKVKTDLINLTKGDDKSFLFEYTCLNKSIDEGSHNTGLCMDHNFRLDVLTQSTFSILFCETFAEAESQSHGEISTSTSEFQLRLAESLKGGSIPIVIGLNCLLPYDEVIDWSRLALILPVTRLNELDGRLRSVQNEDILEFRRNGRRIYEKYFNSVENVVETVINILRTRIDVPALPYQDLHLPSLFQNITKPKTKNIPGRLTNATLLPSPTFSRTSTLNSLQRYHSWNILAHPFQQFPFNPWSPIIPSESQLMEGTSEGFPTDRPFNLTLGGNIAEEQFTILILTYQREKVLMYVIAQFSGVPFLNKIVVVWNSPNNPSAKLTWPDIGIPVHVVKPERNSLNNRFLPLDIIETEAILTIDDDINLKLEEIVFAFRVWRENRDRLIGFPARYHSYDVERKRWNYGFNELGKGCQYSLILTGAAFFHKFYAYLYTYEMPRLIRDMVDKYKNCEDLAMNFLVAHVSKKPPMKVTSRERFNFKCPGGCDGGGLHTRKGHLGERRTCMKLLYDVYGYIPLMFTTFRGDSLYYKTYTTCYKTV